MNVFWRELVLRRKGQIGWAVAIIVFMVLSVIKFDTLASDAAASEMLLKQFPSTIQAVFGMTGLSLSTLSGYYGVLFIYLAVILAIHAGMLGAGLLSDEERDKTAEFLFVKPKSRASIVTGKLFAGLVYMGLLWAVVVMSTWLATLNLSDTAAFIHDFWNFMMALGIIQLTVFCLGCFLAAITTNPRLPARWIGLFVFVSYLMFALTKLAAPLDVLKYGSIFSYFDAADIIQHGALRLVYVVVCGGVIVVSLVGLYVRYRRRDLSV